MNDFNYCERGKRLFLKTQVRYDKSSMLNYIPLSGKKCFIGAIRVDSLTPGGFLKNKITWTSVITSCRVARESLAALWVTLNCEPCP